MQSYILDKIKSDGFSSNMMILGKAGTGKSHLIKQIMLLSKSLKSNVKLLAPTGIAAVNISSTQHRAETLHSFFGLPINETKISHLTLLNITKYKKSNFKKFDVFIIDEVSMMGLTTFENIDYILRKTLNVNHPFAGKILILVGDFKQLKPVNEDIVLQSKVLQGMFKHKVYELTHVYRQTNIDFINILNEIRNQEISHESINVLKALEKKKISDDQISDVTYLYATNNEVDKHNTLMMSVLQEQEQIYECVFSSKLKENVKQQYVLLKQNQIDKNLLIKKGCRVMITRNNPSLRVVNGDVGVVIDYNYTSCTIKLHNGRVVNIGYIKTNLDDRGLLYIGHLPLKVAYALTINKSQGLSIPLLHIDLKRIFEIEQFYVALSRCTCLEGLFLSNFTTFEKRFFI